MTTQTQETWRALKPGERAGVLIELGTFRERLRLAWHFLKCAAGCLVPWKQQLGSTIKQGLKPSERGKK